MTGYVYFVRGSTTLKVGYSINPLSRLAHFRQMAPSEHLRLIACIPGSLRLEKEIHSVLGRDFKSLPYNREWFRVGRKFSVKRLLARMPDIRAPKSPKLVMRISLDRESVSMVRRASMRYGIAPNDMFQMMATAWLKSVRPKRKVAA